MASLWTTQNLYEALSASELSLEGKIELNDGLEPNISVQLSEFGDLPVQITVSGAQLMVSSALWEASQVKDLARFNEAALKLNPVNALSNIGLITLAPGRDLYIMFGELSASSDLPHIIEEIRVLADNTIEAAEVFSDQLIPSPANTTGAAT
jgi:uncharacterized protein